ncbi:hypothetical protein SacN8_09960 [Sulfolobus acidocaldarius N8]|uniref:Uncharacterized protein n=2 Tax=Sulfolobus acidocaldarius TaxID=2285 RepID=M1IFP3_9CREN|nr:hypothetical protein SacN8_09960 [Sulfolobus acidocaldarius N8]AGE74218.1 hypothetical protein SacRon12I_09980 [Sulfolobus acidocaldarius Ron12/I]
MAEGKKSERKTLAFTGGNIKRNSWTKYQTTTTDRGKNMVEV